MGGLLKEFKSEELKDFKTFGKTLFSQTKPLILDKDYNGELFNQLHIFFGSIEGSMHALMAAENVDDAQKHLKQLKESFSKYSDFFE